MTRHTTNKKLLVAEESTIDTAESTVDKRIGVIDDVSDSIERETLISRGISQRSPEQLDTGLIEPSFSASGDFQNGRVLKYATGGTVSHTENSGDVTHTFSVLETGKFPTLTVHSAEGVSSESGLQYTGAVLEELTISTEEDGHVTIDTSFQGHSPPETITSSETYPSSDNPVFPHSQTTTKVDGTQIDVVQSLDITFTNDVTSTGGLGSTARQDVRVATQDVTFSLTSVVTDNTIAELFLGGTTATTDDTPSVFELDFEATNGVSNGSGERRLTIVIEDIVTSTFEKESSVGEFVELTLEGQGTIKKLENVDDITSSNF
jgi:hypothetical protein